RTPGSPESTSLPVVQSTPAGRAAGAPDSEHRLSPAEIERKIQQAGAAGSVRLDKEWQKLVDGLDAPQMPPLLAAIEKLASRRVRETLRSAFLRRWGENDPAAAVAWAQALADKAARKAALAQVFRGWSFTDPGALVAWARQLPAGDLRAQAM